MTLSQIHSRQTIQIFTTHLPVAWLEFCLCLVKLELKYLFVLTGKISVVLLKASMFCVLAHHSPMTILGTYLWYFKAFNIYFFICHNLKMS